MYLCGSEDDVVDVGELEFLADVLLPGGVEGDELGEEVGAHGALDHVGGVELLAAVVALHASAGALHVLAVVGQNGVQLLVLVRDLLPVVDDGGPIEEGSVGEHLGHGEDPALGLPGDVGEGVLGKAEEVLEASLLVALVDALLAQPELLQFPVVLLAHRSE